ncbi:MAG: hypothetical protein WCK49_06605, partial [Myxococcaceae bacterium]
MNHLLIPWLLALGVSPLFAVTNHTVTREVFKQLCQLPYSVGMLTEVNLPRPQPPSQIPFSTAVLQSTATAVASTAVISMVVVSPGSVVQGSRGTVGLQIASCQEDSEIPTDPLGWSDSPTQLSLGSDDLSYYSGAVVGNWLLLTGLFTGHGLLAVYFGRPTMRFPGGMILPVMFLTPTMATSATTLYRFGNTTDQAIGTISLIGQGVYSVSILYVLVSADFKAVYNPTEYKWVDTSQPGFVKQYGLLFKDYGHNRQWFMGLESFFSIAAGMLGAYNLAQTSCSNLLAAGTSFFGSYALAQSALRPAKTKYDRIYYSAVSGSQLLSILLNTIGSAVDSDDMRKVGNGLAVATQWLVAARGIFDGLRQIKEIYGALRSGIKWTPSQAVAKQETVVLKELIDDDPALLLADNFLMDELPEVELTNLPTAELSPTIPEVFEPALDLTPPASPILEDTGFMG